MMLVTAINVINKGKISALNVTNTSKLLFYVSYDALIFLKLIKSVKTKLVKSIKTLNLGM